jgi:hypothetical protein
MSGGFVDFYYAQNRLLAEGSRGNALDCDFFCSRLYAISLPALRYLSPGLRREFVLRIAANRRTVSDSVLPIWAGLRRMVSSKPVI